MKWNHNPNIIQCFLQTNHPSFKCFKLIRPSVPKYIRIKNRQSPFMDVLTNGPEWSGNSSEISIRVFIWSSTVQAVLGPNVVSENLFRPIFWSEIWFGPVFGHFVSEFLFDPLCRLPRSGCGFGPVRVSDSRPEVFWSGLDFRID